MAETSPEGTSVSEASESTETTKATDPMATAPAAPTEAQQEEAGTTDVIKPSEEAVSLYRQDAEWRVEHPSEPRIREANPQVGGEDNSYLDTVSS